MATYDNKAWLLKNVRDAFIATDDTGLCEIVMAGEDFSKIYQNKAIEEKKRDRDKVLYQPSTSRGKESETDDEDEKEVVTQFDPYPDMEDSDEDEPCPSYPRFTDEMVHRQRSNTAQWLDKKELALKKAAKIKVIKWEDPPATLTAEQMSEVFSKVNIVKPEKKKSLLAEMLEKCPDLPHRQYLEYAKFDGTAQLGLPTKSFKIFMTMLPEKHQNYPLIVCVIASAKIKDLIGFTCYKYSIEHPDITLGSVHDYGLYIAEDDGEVDWAFPCLDNNEPCSKFGFTCLGLDLKRKENNSCPIADFEMNSFTCFPKASVSGQSNVNTSRQKTGDSDTSEIIRAMNTLNEGNRGKLGFQSGVVTDASQDKLYRVQLLHKVRANTPVQLGITLDTIEVVPLVTNKHAFWARPKYFLHSMNSVAWCQILEARSSKTTFRIVYSPSHDILYHDRNNSVNVNLYHPNTIYKKHDFECEHDTARKIVDKVNTILDLRNSPCRREYKSVKEKKLQTRTSFNAKHMS
ncbi:target of rapamycin complex 2 subunit MAPKAP1 like protein [Danaus plexippus plexippus]|uniref:Target of rapamycin complex 2 subunit MAPKAP1 like protein n=1 Tax=Danaus plexippus plexippus TaxID=278856 RepID=A0A212ERH0_DANPL|nr:target of rapamycin complex 2 subunit MAPKAP1 like protein [Danaus plexippus plexippus]